MVEYKLIYKMPGIDKWKYFFMTSADNDMQAVKMAGIWANNNNAEKYMLEKITTERLV